MEEKTTWSFVPSWFLLSRDGSTSTGLQIPSKFKFYSKTNHPASGLVVIVPVKP